MNCMLMVIIVTIISIILPLNFFAWTISRGNWHRFKLVFFYIQKRKPGSVFEL